MKIFRIAAAGALALIATGCFLTPGRFDAALDLRRDGSFSYRYDGEVVFLGATPGSEPAPPEPFNPDMQMCEGDGGDFRDCTAQELEQKREEHEEQAARMAEENRRSEEQARAMLGGLDPKDPRTMDEFARRLQSYDGWKRVSHKGNGVFQVLYEKSGRLDHDFIFPVFPEVDLIVPFVHATRRGDGRVRVAAPALVRQTSMMGSLAGFGAQAGAADKAIPKAEGTFTLTTDAEILTNNTNEGPAPAAGGAKLLRWTVGPLDSKKPEALLKM